MTAKERYQEFLKSEFWRNLSYECRDKVGFICQKCFKPNRPVHAHHKLYRVSWYATKLEDLICLCSDCHDLEHGIKQPEPQKSSITRRMRIGKSRFHRFWKDHAKLTKKPKKKYEMVKYSNGSKWLSRSSSGHHAPSKSNGDNFQAVDGRTVFNPK